MKVKSRDTELAFARKICANLGIAEIEKLSLMDCLYRLSEKLLDCRKELMNLRGEGTTFPLEVKDAEKENHD